MSETESASANTVNLAPDAVPASDLGEEGKAGKKKVSQPDIPLGAGAWLAAVGITAGLALIGFIVKFAREQLLGVSLGSWTALDLSVYAGRWAADTVTIVLSQIFLSLTFGLLMVLLFAPVVASLILPKDHPRARILAVGSLGLSCTALLFTLVWWQAPTTYIKGWLTTGLGNQIESTQYPGLMGRREEGLRLDLFTSKMGTLADNGQIRCGPLDQDHARTMVPPPPKASLQFAKFLTGKKGLPSAQSTQCLQWIYGLCVLANLAGWLTISRSMPDGATPLVKEVFGGLRLLLTLVLLPITSCLLPYMYGKLLFTTFCPSANITFRPPAKDLSTPPVMPFTDQDTVLIVDQTDTAISAVKTDASEAVPYVYVLSRSDILDLAIGPEQDLFYTDLKRCQWFPVQSPPQ